MSMGPPSISGSFLRASNLRMEEMISFSAIPNYCFDSASLASFCRSYPLRMYATPRNRLTRAMKPNSSLPMCAVMYFSVCVALERVSVRLP